MIEIIRIQKEALERIGRNWVGNIYRYGWVAYALDDRTEPYGIIMQDRNGEEAKVKKVFEGSKRDLLKFLQAQSINPDVMRDAFINREIKSQS